MTGRVGWLGGGLSLVLLGQAGGLADEAIAPALAERRALTFLVREVPQWSRENRCFSCHNNGDAARALFMAQKKGKPIPQQALRDTIDFLGRPDRWDRNGVDAAFSDKSLARLQFAGALVAAIDAGAIADRSPLRAVAQRLADEQSAEGAWKIDEAALIGSPTTYGTTLGTALARRILIAADVEAFSKSSARAARWLQERPVQNVLETAAILIGLDADEVSEPLRKRCLALIRKGQSPEGGWGPFVNAPAETFDTAITLLALSRWPDPKEVAPLIRLGRKSLLASQLEDGSWIETTRPTGGESYAQRLSTSGWATLALLATDGRD